MIIVEGTDKSGKSTFITNLIQNFPDSYRKTLRNAHFGILPDDWDYCEDYINFITPNIILDRYIDSERAYGPLYRGQVNKLLGINNMIKVYSRCAEIGALLVYCNPPFEIIKQRIENLSDEMIKNQEQLIKLRELFDSVFTKNYPLEIETVDTSSPLSPYIYKNIINKSLVLNRFSETLKSLNYRGFVSPYSQYVIYTSHMNISDIQQYIFQSSEIPFTRFAIVYSRNIINKPVDLNSLNMAMNIKSPVIVFGFEAIEDFNAAGNCLPKVDCTSFPQFIDNIKSIR